MRQFASPMTIALLMFMAFNSLQRGTFSSPLEWFMEQVYILPGIVIALSFHEFAHAYVAYKLGDNTPKLQGRVTINPGAHIDPIGFIALIFVRFGWGKPVEINPRNFKKPRRDGLLVSLAGVTMNLILAIIFTFVLKIFIMSTGIYYPEESFMGSIYSIIFYIIYINLVLMVFNLLPVPPLDGFNVVTEIFDLKKYKFYYEIYDKGFIILMILILFNFTGKIMTPILSFFFDILENFL